MSGWIIKKLSCCVKVLFKLLLELLLELLFKLVFSIKLESCEANVSVVLEYDVIKVYYYVTLIPLVGSYILLIQVIYHYSMTFVYYNIY